MKYNETPMNADVMQCGRHRGHDYGFNALKPRTMNSTPIPNASLMMKTRKNRGEFDQAQKGERMMRIA